MARYFLHLHADGTVLEDLEGQECGSLEAALCVATASARDVMVGELRTGRLSLDRTIYITDVARDEVGPIAFRDAVAVTGLNAPMPAAKLKR